MLEGHSGSLTGLPQVITSRSAQLETVRHVSARWTILEKKWLVDCHSEVAVSPNTNAPAVSDLSQPTE